MRPNTDMSHLLNWSDRPVPALRVVPAPVVAKRAFCAYDLKHTFMVAETVEPTPVYCSPRCASAAGRREMRRDRASGDRA